MSRTKGSGNVPKVKPKSAVPQLPDLKLPQNADPTVTQRVAAFQHEVLKLYVRAYRHRDFPDVIEECFQRYLMLLAEYDMKMTNTAAYTAIGLTKEDMYNLRHGRRHASDPRYLDLVNMIDTMCAMAREQYLVEGAINPATGIWGQKNWDGFEEIPPKLPETQVDDDGKTAEQIKEQYKYLIGQEDPK